jgi:TfoX/Sxy family transcriptional regulator of competence genes
MAYDEGAAQRLRDLLADRDDVVEKKMFGGIAFMLRGNMCIGVNKDTLMVRVGKENHDEAVSQPHARPMDFTGKPMQGFIFVEPEGYESDEDLEGWLQRGMDYVLTLPAK